MSDFEIHTTRQEPILLANHVPEKFQKFALAGSDTQSATGDFGTLLFQHFEGRGFDIWYSHYFIRKAAGFVGSVNMPILELQIPLLNSFESSWDTVSHVQMKEHQFELTYTPFVQTTSQFREARDYQTFDIHFSKETLTEYAPYCRRLSAFLEMVEKGRPANLLDTAQFLSLDMVRIIGAMIRYEFPPGLTTNYFTSLVHELLTLVTVQVSNLTDKPAFAPHDLAAAQEAHKLIIRDFEVYETVEQLAAKLGTTEVKLQLAFKYLYGVTVAKFSRQARLQKSVELLQQTNYPLRVICMMVGYPDPSNFSFAFYKQYGYWPGKIQKQ